MPVKVLEASALSLSLDRKVLFGGKIAEVEGIYKI